MALAGFSQLGSQYGKLSSTMAWQGELCWRGTAWWEMALWMGGCYCGCCGWEAAVKCRHRKLLWWWCPASWRLFVWGQAALSRLIGWAIYGSFLVEIVKNVFQDLKVLRCCPRCWSSALHCNWWQLCRVLLSLKSSYNAWLFLLYPNNCIYVVANMCSMRGCVGWLGCH